MITKKLIDDCFVPAVDRMKHADAIALLRDRVVPVVGVERLTFEETCGRVLSEPASARFPVPLHTNSAVDGYAFPFAS